MIQLTKRSVPQALLDGALLRCPKCHEGKLLDGYLTVQTQCPSCAEDFSSQRSDDGPAWATILISCHIAVPVISTFYSVSEGISPWFVFFWAGAIITIMTLLLLPRVKGMFVAFQWANYMYGFNPSKRSERKSE